MFDGERLRLPEGIEMMPPGPELARVLGSIDRDGLSGFDRVVLLKARSRLRAHVEAELYADMMSVVEATAEELGSDFELGEVFDWAASEIRAALIWTRRAAECQLSFASLLVEDYPQVWKALLDGRIDGPKARVICDQTMHLDPDTRAKVADVALEQASTQTTGQLRARLARLVIGVDPESARKRYEHGIEERRVTADGNDDGTANLSGWQLPAAETQAVMRRINRLARAARSSDDPRTMDQLRADVFVDLLKGRSLKHGRADRGVVDIHVDLTTLTGLSETPGEIPGWGPVIADIARQVVAEQRDAEHRVTVTDPDTGAVVWNGITRRRPTTGQRRHVESRNPTCVFPGCRMPSVDCDLDHNQPWARGGPTTVTNLAPLCRHDHLVKEKGWKIRQIRPGAYQLTSPLGHTYTTQPQPP